MGLFDQRLNWNRIFIRLNHKQKLIQSRVTEKEYDLVKFNAHLLGMNISEFQRYALNKACIWPGKDNVIFWEKIKRDPRRNEMPSTVREYLESRDQLSQIPLISHKRWSDQELDEMLSTGSYKIMEMASFAARSTLPAPDRAVGWRGHNRIVRR
jgi:hypothetical protein